MTTRALAGALLLAASGLVHACGEALPAARTTVENADYTVVFATTPHPVPVGAHFVVDFAVCARENAPPPQSVRVDATMPEHRHGMNYRPTLATVAPGVYRAEGLLFHMPGRWEFAFDVVAGGGTQRLTSSVVVR